MILSVVVEVVGWSIPRHGGWGPIRARGLSYRRPGTGAETTAQATAAVQGAGRYELVVGLA